MINALENKSVYTAQKVSLKDSDIASYKAKLKDQQESAGLLIFSLKARVKELKDKLECSSQGSDRTESSDKIQNDHNASPLENPAKHGGTIDKTTCSKISAGAPSQKLAEQNITSAVPSIAILGAGKALLKVPVGDTTSTVVSEEYITPFMFNLMYIIIAIMLVIWCILTLIEKFQRSSGTGLHFKDDFIHLPEKTVYLSDLIPAKGAQSQRLLHN